MKNSYLKIDRGIKNHCFWDDKPFAKGQAWIDLILLATHTDRKDFDRGQLREKKRGEVHISLLKLADRWGWSRNKVRRFINLLVQEGMCTLNATTNDTTITIEKYSIYQGWYTTDDTTDETTRETTDDTTRETTREPQTIMSNKDKECIKNDKEIEKGKKFTPPTLQEVTAYCMERNNGIEPQTFIDFYQSKNWMIGKSKMKDWRACIRTWESRRSKERQGTMNDLKEAYQKFERMEVME